MLTTEGSDISFVSHLGVGDIWRSKHQHPIELAHYCSAQRDPHPHFATLVSRLRYRVDAMFGRLVERCAVKRVWARDLWHLCSRSLRTVLMRALAVLLNVDLGNPPLQFAQVVAEDNLHIGLISKM